MLRQMIRCGLTVAFMTAASSALAFSLGGPLTAPPDDRWQTPEIGYRLAGDVLSPRNIGEEYRWNTPFLYYSFDQTFLDYFGSNGVFSVDQAMAIFNGATNVSSDDFLGKFSLNVRRNNFRAAALNLEDLKSVAMTVVAEQVGLAEPERYTWALHDRLMPANVQCPFGMQYIVNKLSFDPVTGEPTSYLNGALLTYTVVEVCNPPNPLADAVELPVDPLAFGFQAVADGTAVGNFFTGLSRDDAGGLRYMWSTNNVNYESVDASAQLVGSGGVGGSTFQTITTSNLADLVQAASTNSAAQLQALFPDLVITSSTNLLPQVVLVTNVIAYFTNYPYSPAGTPAALVFATVITPTIQQLFSHTFGNVVTNSYYTNGVVTITTTNVSIQPFSPPGSLPQTVVTSQKVIRNFISGDYFIIPTNVCDFQVLSTLLTNVIPVTTTVVATNATATNIAGQTFSQSTTTYFTNHTLLVSVTSCPTNAPGGVAAPALLQGMNGVRFIRTSFDSLLGQFITPITTNYNLNSVVNGDISVQRYRRTVNRPDFLFAAADLAGAPGDQLLQYATYRRPQLNTVTSFGGSVSGPGIIQASTLIEFNKAGPAFINVSPFFMTELTATSIFRFASYDGSTNAPVIYPSGTSIQNLENQVLIQFTPSSLPDGTMGVPYTVQVGVIGGQPPYAFSSPGLPPGLSISATGLISGTPTEDGTFDFTVRMLDAAGRQVDGAFSLTINL